MLKMKNAFLVQVIVTNVPMMVNVQNVGMDIMLTMENVLPVQLIAASVPMMVNV